MSANRKVFLVMLSFCLLMLVAAAVCAKNMYKYEKQAHEYEKLKKYLKEFKQVEVIYEFRDLETGEPVHNVKIQLNENGPDNEIDPLCLELNMPTDSSVKINWVGHNPYVVTFKANGYIPKSVTIDPETRATMEVKLVRDADSKEIISGTLVK